MDISSATSSLFSSSSRYDDQKRPSNDANAFLALLSDRTEPLSSLQVQPVGDARPLDRQPTFEGLPDRMPVQNELGIDGLPVEPETKGSLDGLPVEPSDPYVDPQILLTQKLAASLMGGGWGTIDPPAAAAAA